MALTTSAATDMVGWNFVVGTWSQFGNGHQIMSVWVNPSTFTAGRFLCMNVSLSGTSELKIESAQFTTNDTWTTSGAGLAVGKWSYICIIRNGVTSGAQDMRCWVGDANTPPVLLSTSFTAGSGGLVSSTIYFVGNTNNTGSSSAPAGNLAFQGTTDGWYFLGDTIAPAVTGAANDGMGSEWGVASAFTANDEKFFLDRFVTPLWRGENPVMNKTITPTTTVARFYFETMDTAGYLNGARRGSGASTLAGGAPTLTGITAAIDRCPRPMVNIDALPYRRR